MSKNVNEISRQGSPTANEIYLSVGQALSWWEASEDMLEQLMTELCNNKEPIALETFRVAPRQARAAMIKSALKHQCARITKEEDATILTALKHLEKLSKTRNEIAHGYVQHITLTEDGNTTMTGNYLASTLDRRGLWTSREANKKYALTAAEIDDWRDRVRNERGNIMDVFLAIITRDQESQRQA